ncbi:MAG: BlaI/MecI/CopY family transcriptional regulator [Verrucomicrobiota bacterium]|jgi:predicted transcriptional regulator|nr:BlaI/MecI/CopY family transcriptional regulator [Verrucomicrobiota bacterium]
MITNASLPELTESEWAVIKAVWQLEPCPAPTVQEHLAGQRDWSVSTVRTVMERMAAKGLLTSEKLRNLTLYRSAVSRQQAQLGELRYALKNAFDGALTPMVQCLLESERLDSGQLDQLEALIAAQRQARAIKIRTRKP